MTTYTFNCVENYPEDLGPFPAYKQSEVTFTYDEAARWDHVLYGFLQFLGGVYGYPVVDKVSINGVSVENAVYNDLFSFEANEKNEKTDLFPFDLSEE